MVCNYCEILTMYSNHVLGIQELIRLLYVNVHVFHINTYYSVSNENKIKRRRKKKRRERNYRVN